MQPQERILKVFLAILDADKQRAPLTRLELQQRFKRLRVSRATLDRDIALLKDYQFIKVDLKAKPVGDKVARRVYLPNRALWFKGQPTF